MKYFCAVVFGLLLLTNALHASSADTLVLEGRAFLVAHDLTNANTRFAAALNAAPKHEAANVFYAATRLLTLANTPAGKALLDRFGVAATNRDVYAWTAFLPVDANNVPVPATNTSPADVAAYLRTSGLSEIVAAEANLATVTNSKFSLMLTANETLLEKVTIDYGDLLLMRAGLKLAQYGIYTINSWNLDAQLTGVRALLDREGLTAEQFLAEYPQLMTFATTNDLVAARQAFSEAVALYNIASGVIRARPATDIRLFTYAPDESQSELMFRTSLNELKASLAGPVVTSLDAHYSVNFGRHFAGTVPFRAFLPVVKGNTAVAGTLPDPTLDGLILGASCAQAEKLLYRRIPFAPRLTVPGRLPDGRIYMSLNAVDGTLVALQSSLDLAQWQTVSILAVSNGIVTLADNPAGGASAQYYRALDLSRALPSDFAPPNDDFSRRLVIAGTNISTGGFGGNGTIEPGEPDHTGYDGGSLWWTWTAPKSGAFHLDTTGADFGLTLLLYQGNSVDGLTRIAQVDDWRGEATLAFEASAGATYQIAVVWPWWERAGQVFLNLFEVPGNDSMDRAIPLGGMTNIVSGSNVGATKEYLSDFDIDEPDHAGQAGGKSIWWTWTPTVDGLVTIDTAGSSFDTLLAVYRNGDGWLSEVAANDDSGAGQELSSRVSFSALRNVTYYIAVDGYLGASGSVNLALRQPAAATPPTNNAFANATLLQGAAAHAYGTTFGANTEVGEPPHFSYSWRGWNGYAEGRSVWWKWTAPISGSVSLWVTTDFVPVLSVYTGTAVSNLNLVVDGESYGDAVGVSFRTYAGATYYFAVDAQPGTSGDIQLSLEHAMDSTYGPGYVELENEFVLVGGTAGWRPRVEGSFPMTFQWKHNGTNIPGATNLQLTILSATTNQSGTYQLALTNLDGGTVSEAAVLSVLAPVPNDAFANASVLVGRTNTVASQNILATVEPGEYQHFYGSSKSLWWTWTAPVSGSVTIDTVGSDFYYAGVVIYTGTSVNSLNYIASDVGSAGGGASTVTFSADAGTTYKIVVDGYNQSSGNIVLRLRQP